MTEAASTVLMDTNQIRAIIPHRFPFLLIDRIIEMSFETKRLVAIKNVTANEQHFMGHYPDHPVTPGVLLIESMAQAAAVYMLSMPENKGKIPFFTGINEARFRREVVPGDQLRIEVEVLKIKSRVGKTMCKGYVDGQVAVEAELTCMLGDAPAQED
jgi:3-hydroxyacyl-[acyl-carrier-protein] dehydratase